MRSGTMTKLVWFCEDMPLLAKGYVGVCIEATPTGVVFDVGRLRIDDATVPVLGNAITFWKLLGMIPFPPPEVAVIDPLIPAQLRVILRLFFKSKGVPIIAPDEAVYTRMRVDPELTHGCLIPLKEIFERDMGKVKR
jgi:hypothetical protein